MEKNNNFHTSKFSLHNSISETEIENLTIDLLKSQGYDYLLVETLHQTGRIH